MTDLDFRTTNSLWCSVLAETLFRCGVRHAVCSPGSRSTPLTFAFARHEGIEALPVLDERSAAFFALGLAKQTRRPVVLVCTSGTAGANYLPAIIEAKESGVPLVAITADRPPEMRECSSGQTIDQQKLFGSYVNWYHELAVPEPKLEMLCYLRQTIAHAYTRASHAGAAGPVHLNAPFRDPLPPLEDDSAKALAGELDDPFFAHLDAQGAAVLPAAVPALPAVVRGLIIAGPSVPSDARGYADMLATLSHKTGWPVLADSLSPLRTQVGAGQAWVSCYDVLARNPGAMEALKPDFVVSIGGWPISKSLRSWLQQIDVPMWLIAERSINVDALHGRTRQLAARLEDLVVQCEDRTRAGDYSEKWIRVDRRARAQLVRELADIDWLFEGKAIWTMSHALPPATPLFVANSMPVRDLEYFWEPNNRGAQIYFSRGANGIDGTLSTAMGIAHGNEKPAVLLTGDLALLHDANGFLLSRKLRGSLTVVLINNEGGGIFEHLPVAQFNPPFEEFFATPQHVDFAGLCASHGVEHVAVRDWTHFRDLIARLPASGVRVVEIRTDRKRDAAARKRIFAAAAGALDQREP